MNCTAGVTPISHASTRRPVTFSTEHRAAASQDHVPVQLTQSVQHWPSQSPRRTPPFLSQVLNLAVARLSSGSSRSWPAWSNPSPSSSCASSAACAPVCFLPHSLARPAWSPTIAEAINSIEFAIRSRFPFPAYRPPGKGRPKCSLRAEDKATLGSDPSADWSPANGRSGRLHTKAARLAHCRGREKAINPCLFSHHRMAPQNWANSVELNLPRTGDLIVLTICRHAMLQP